MLVIIWQLNSEVKKNSCKSPEDVSHIVLVIWPTSDLGGLATILHVIVHVLTTVSDPSSCHQENF